MSSHPRSHTRASVIASLRAHGSQRNVRGMARYGIVSPKAFGVSAPLLKALARKIGTDHELALSLWRSGWYEARMLAAFVADPKRISLSTMNDWARDFDNWAITDGLCIHLFRKTPNAHRLVRIWTKRQGEFIRRAGFTMIATLAVHDTLATNAVFRSYLRTVRHYANDDRNGVCKAVNWALRQIGKRNHSLHRDAVRVAVGLSRSDSPSGRWIAHDALRELRDPRIRARFRRA